MVTKAAAPATTTTAINRKTKSKENKTKPNRQKVADEEERDINSKT